jgi:pimeloyl-ACP methyl ester carboxylesterase
VELFGRPTHELIIGSELKIYQQGPHGLPLTHPDRLTADILNFAKS